MKSLLADFLLVWKQHILFYDFKGLEGLQNFMPYHSVVGDWYRKISISKIYPSTYRGNESRNGF